MHLILIFLNLMLQPPTTIEACLLKYGDSHLVYDQYTRALPIQGIEVQDYVTVLTSAQPIAGTRFVTDTGYRRVQWYLYEGDLYIAVFRHRDAPGAYVEIEQGPDHWHLSCLLKDIDFIQDSVKSSRIPMYLVCPYDVTEKTDTPYLPRFLAESPGGFYKDCLQASSQIAESLYNVVDTG